METSAHIKYLLANEQDNRWGVVVTTTGYQIIALGRAAGRVSLGY